MQVSRPIPGKVKLRRFRFIDHTGDLGLAVFGETLEGLFVHAAEALFHVLTDPRRIRQRQSRDLALEAGGLEELLVSWLGELLFLFETEQLLFRRFEVRQLEGRHMEATAWGERYEEGRHPIKTLIKAVTFHQLRVEQVRGRWRARIVLDL